MIPKVIHYCWFGGKALPRSARKCIASWRKFLPDYKIMEWNESNFNVNMIPYTAEAYAAKKYAFVSDFARFWVLYHHGGVYFDTDVEVIRSMEDIIAKGAFMGIEAKASPEQTSAYVAPGLGIACEPKHEVWGKIINEYTRYEAFKTDKNVCGIVSEILRRLNISITFQGGAFPGLTLYPADYFCPQAKMGAPIRLTGRTRSIHHYDASWLPLHIRLRVRLLSYLPQSLASYIRRLTKHFIK